MSYIEVIHEFKRYKMGENEIVANNDVNFEIEKGELVVILGASGAGKSTLLNILGGMDSNDESKVIIDGKDISKIVPFVTVTVITFILKHHVNNKLKKVDMIEALKSVD